MANLNKCMFIGRVTRDPELRYMPNGEAVANCSVACNESWKAKDGSKQERVEYINLVFYRRLAEVVGEYCKKGSKIYAEGRIQSRKWQDKDTGQDRYRTEIVVNEMQLLDGRGSAEPFAEDAPSESPAAPVAREVKPPAPFQDDDLPF